MNNKIIAVIVSILALATTVFGQSRSRFGNLSTRGFVGTGDFVLIAGSIIVGSELKTVIVRALGPSLDNYGLLGTLPDPVLEIYDSNGGLIARNDDWRDDPYAYQVQAYGLAPSYDSESAIYDVVPPGSYTVIVRGYRESVGLALVEIYDPAP